MRGQGMTPGTCNIHHKICLVIGNKKIYGLVVGISTVYETNEHFSNQGAWNDPGDPKPTIMKFILS